MLSLFVKATGLHLKHIRSAANSGTVGLKGLSSSRITLDLKIISVFIGAPSVAKINNSGYVRGYIARDVCAACYTLL